MVGPTAEDVSDRSPPASVPVSVARQLEGIARARLRDGESAICMPAVLTYSGLRPGSQVRGKEKKNLFCLIIYYEGRSETTWWRWRGTGRRRRECGARAFPARWRWRRCWRAERVLICATRSPRTRAGAPGPAPGPLCSPAIVPTPKLRCASPNSDWQQMQLLFVFPHKTLKSGFHLICDAVASVVNAAPTDTLKM